MATIHHSQYLTDISAQNFVRAIVAFLTTFEAKAGVMWSVVFENDTDAGNEFAAAPFVYVLKKDTTSVADEAPLYAKIMFLEDRITVIASNTYTAAVSPNDLVLTGSQRNDGEADNTIVAAYNAAGTLTAPGDMPVSSIIFDATFDPVASRFSKAWLVRQLDPLFDMVGERKNTNISFWASICSLEEGDDPITRRGYYHHIGFGVAGETLVPDATYSHGPGIYTVAGSFVSDAATTLADERVFAGGGGVGGSIVCVGDWEGTHTWFATASMYGQVRDPFDEAMLYNGTNVGFDFTELCKYSPYSGVRVLTPAYVFGNWDNLFRILCRIPIFYTDMAGLYAGDVITQIVDNDTKNYMIFPLVNYRCSGSMESKRGYAILVPNDEEV